jgi:hypothetical protein
MCLRRTLHIIRQKEEFWFTRPHDEIIIKLKRSKSEWIIQIKVTGISTLVEKMYKYEDYIWGMTSCNVPARRSELLLASWWVFALVIP